MIDLNTFVGGAAGLMGLAAAAIGLRNQNRIERARLAAAEASAKADATAETVQSISVNVDGRLSELIERQAQLLGALHQSGTPVPPRPPEPPPAVTPVS